MMDEQALEHLRSEAQRLLGQTAPDQHQLLQEELRREAVDTEKIAELVATVLEHHDLTARRNAVALMAAANLPLTRKLDPKLLAALSDADETVRHQVLILTESRLETGDRRFTPFLRRALRDEAAGIRYWALQHVRRRGIDVASGLLPELTALLDAHEEDVNRQAVLALAWLGRDGRPAIKGLIDLLVRKDSELLRREVLLALPRIDPEFSLTRTAVAGVNDPAVRQVILRLLQDQGERGRDLRLAVQEAWASPPPASPVQPPDPTPAERGGGDEGAGGGKQHPDGPEDPNRVWWNGQSKTLEPVPFQLLKALWGKDAALVVDVEGELWPERLNPTPASKSALHKINLVLAELGVPFRYGEKAAHFVKKPV